MKKLSRSAVALVALLMMAFGGSFSANADECSQSVSKICGVFDNLASQFNNLKSLDDITKINFDQPLKDFDVSGIKDECADYVLTTYDKSELTKSYMNFYNTFGERLYTLSNGLLSREMIDQQIVPIKEAFTVSIEKCTTLGEFITSFSNLLQ